MAAKNGSNGRVNGNNVYIERMDAEEFAPDKSLVYVDAFGLHELYDGLWEHNRPTIVVGPKGIGKTLSVQAYAAQKDCPVVTFDCSEDVRRSHLLGMFVLRGDETPYVLGPVTTAFELANEVGRAILVLEEVNALTPQMQKLLNGISDFRTRVEVPEAKKVFRLEGDAKLWVVGTMNTAVYGGVYQLNEDLKSRFRLIALEYPQSAKERQILREVMVDSKVDEETIKQVLLLAHETRQQALDYSLSTRDVVQIVEDIEALGLPQAMRIALGKFDGDERSTVRTRMESIFANLQLS